MPNLGTDFLKAGVIGEEKAWGGSGGGFSDTFTIPDYQVLMIIFIFFFIAFAASTIPATSTPTRRLW